MARLRATTRAALALLAVSVAACAADRATDAPSVGADPSVTKAVQRTSVAAPVVVPAATPAPAQDPPAEAALSGTITPRPPVVLSVEERHELEDQVAELRTSHGTIVFGFLPEKAPSHVSNFIELARSGFYDGTLVHRVIPGLLLQGGDPTGTGDGGPGYFIGAEFNDEPHVRGTVSMARLRHRDGAGSQFFICLGTQPYMDGAYSAFGRVLSGDETVARIEALGAATPQGKPSETITVEKVLIRPRLEAERLTASRQP